MDTDTPAPRAEYINNPFMVAVSGLNLLFLNAQSIAIFLVILSVLRHLPSLNQNQLSSTTPTAIPTTQAILAMLPLLIGFGVVALIIALITWTIISGICGYASARVARGETVTLGEAAKATFQHFGDLLWLRFLVSVKLLAWTLLLIVPGVIMSVRYSLAFTAYFDKKLRGNAAIKESIALTRGSWMTTFGSQVVFNVITFGIISSLVQTGVNSILYRQFSTTPSDQRPATHGLSVAALIVQIAGGVLLIAAIVIGVILLATHTIQPQAWRA